MSEDEHEGIFRGNRSFIRPQTPLAAIPISRGVSETLVRSQCCADWGRLVVLDLL